VVFLWLHHRQVAGRSLSLASPGVKRQLSVRGGCGGCATGKSRGARCHSLHPEWNASYLSAVAAVAAPQAIRGALAAARFTRSGTPAVCPRWLAGCDRWAGLGCSLARKRTAGSSSPGNPSSPPQDFFRIFKNSQGFFTPFFQDIMV